MNYSLMNPKTETVRIVIQSDSLGPMEVVQNVSVECMKDLNSMFAMNMEQELEKIFIEEGTLLIQRFIRTLFEMQKTGK